MKKSLTHVAALLYLLGGIVLAGPPLAEREPMTVEGAKGQEIEFIRVSKPGVLLKNCEGITIYCSEFRTIRMEGCKDISIRNCWFHDGPEPGISMERCENVEIIGNRFERVASGLFALECRGVQFIGNYAQDVMGPRPRGQMVQFDDVSGGNLVKGNYGMNLRGKSDPEDMISMYKSNGTADAPIVIEDNYLVGDPAEGSKDKSVSGSGIMLGDGGGSNIVCRRNTLISPGQVGIGVAGGADIAVEDNLVIGRGSNVANVGIYAWNQYPTEQAGGRITIRNNRVSWVNAKGEVNGWWDGGGFSAVVLKGNDFDGKGLEAGPPPSQAPMPPGPMIQEADGKVAVPW